jgi:hypothetical protein
MKIGIVGVGLICTTLTPTVERRRTRGQGRNAGMALVEDTGFDAFDAGPLAGSWRQQPGTPCYCTDLTRAELPVALAAADAARSPTRRDLSLAALHGHRRKLDTRTA